VSCIYGLGSPAEYEKTNLIKMDETQLVIGCVNSGTRMILEPKRETIEKAVSQLLKKPMMVVFVTETEPAKKNPNDLPLVTFEKKKTAAVKQSGIQSRYTFENFAVSPSNQIAHAAALAIVEKPGLNYNPFFIWGGVGVGKTHLSQAIANKIISTETAKNILFCSSEEFTNDLIELIREKNTGGFRKKYRNLDVLIVDDIQFIAGKNYVQEEFYHTFNTIIQRGGQIIMTSDRPPMEIAKLEDRLRSRFSGGLIIDIQNPDFELKAAIALIKARERNIPITMDVARMIAESVVDVRELEGKILTLYTKAVQSGKELTSSLIQEEKNQMVESKLTHQSVIKTVCSYYQVSPASLRKPSRKESIVIPRQVTMYILRVILKLKLDDVAFLLKRKDHTTIIHGVDKITMLMMKNPTFKEEVDTIVRSLMSST
jgi:chromosomal replication initiator protein